jgi:hypothetical protein
MRCDLEISAESLSGRNLNNLRAAKIQAGRAKLTKKLGESLASQNEITTVKQMCERSGPHQMKATVAKAHTPMIALSCRNALWYLGLHVGQAA